MLVLKPRALDNHTKPCTFSANGGISGSIFSLSGNINFIILGNVPAVFGGPRELIFLFVLGQ